MTFKKGEESKVLAAIYGVEERQLRDNYDSQRALALEWNRFVRSQHDRAELMVNPVAAEPHEAASYPDPDPPDPEGVAELDDIRYEMDRTDGRPHWDMEMP